ncbi:unnamed protein product [Staurois parvus]|uniref:Uncharacterized protein n=1 Tax=Staurois parvus TaxID=386267 RepID=A0ABN9B2F6_9NEOB|nr:unnamed protein product [Staurois parvus]
MSGKKKKKKIKFLFWASFPLIIKKKNQERSITIYHQMKAQFVLKKNTVQFT